MASKTIKLAPVICMVLISFQLVGQNLLRSQETLIHDSLVLIGMYEPDKMVDERSDQDFSFWVEGKDNIKRALETLTYGKRSPSHFQIKTYHIKLIEKGEVINEWTIHPYIGSVEIKGVHYSFDVKQVEALAKAYPFTYEYREMSFPSLASYQSYASSINDKRSQFTFTHFILAHNPFGGVFDLTIKKSPQFPAPEKAVTYASDEIQKVAGKDSFKILYSAIYLSGNEADEFTLKVQASDKVYAKITDINFQKGEWKSVPLKKIIVFRVRED